VIVSMRLELERKIGAEIKLPRPVLRGEAQNLQFFGTLYVHPNGLTYSDKIWYGNTRGGMTCFYSGSAFPQFQGGVAPASPIFLVAQRL